MGDVLIEFGFDGPVDKWVLKPELWILQLDKDHWNTDRMFRLCDGVDAGKQYKGRVDMLEGERSLTQTAADLNKGDLECAQGFCAVFSRQVKDWYVMYRPGFRDVAMRAVGFTPEDFNWRWNLLFRLCGPDEYDEYKANFQGDVELLPWNSARSAADLLNANVRTESAQRDGFAVFFSERRQEYEVLYRPHLKNHAVLKLGLPSDTLPPDLVDASPPRSPTALGPPRSPVSQTSAKKLPGSPQSSVKEQHLQVPIAAPPQQLRASPAGGRGSPQGVGREAVPDHVKDTVTVKPADAILTEYVPAENKRRLLAFYDKNIMSMEEYSSFIHQSLLEVEAGRGADRARRAGSVSGDGDVALS